MAYIIPLIIESAYLIGAITAYYVISHSDYWEAILAVIEHINPRTRALPRWLAYAAMAAVWPLYLFDLARVRVFALLGVHIKTPDSGDPFVRKQVEREFRLRGIEIEDDPATRGRDRK